MPPKPRLPLALLLAVSAVSLLAVSCAGVASPKGWASPVLTGDVLVAAHRDELFAFQIDGFDPIWAFPGTEEDIDVEALYGTPAVADGVIYVPTYEGQVYALDLESGELLWAGPFETDAAIIGGVAVAAGAVYVGDDEGKLYAIDAESGRELWPPFSTGEHIWSTPVVAGSNLFVTSLDSHLYVLDAATGAELWTFETAAGVAANPVVDEAQGLVYLGGFDSRLRAIDLETHQQVWSVTSGNWFWGQPLLDRGTVYAASLDGKVYAVSARTSDPMWDAFQTESPVRASPVISGDTLFVVDRDGRVYGIDVQTGADAFRGPLDLGDDVLADPVLLQAPDGGAPVLAAVTTAGDLFLIDTEELEPIRQLRLDG